MTRRMILSTFGSVLVAGGLALFLHHGALAQTAKDVEKKAGEAWESFRDYTYARKNDAVAYGKKLIRQSDDQIRQLQAKASRASGDARVEYKKQVTALKAMQAEAAKNLSAMGKATEASWDAAKQGFADAYRDLYNAYEKAAAQLKS